jgi:hypothetical protein
MRGVKIKTPDDWGWEKEGVVSYIKSDWYGRGRLKPKCCR